MKKTIPLLIFLFLIAARTDAQDTLYFKNGTTEIVKIEEVGTQQIKYYKHNYLDGPVYVVPKNQLRLCMLANGDTLDLYPTSREKISNKNQLDFNLWAFGKSEIDIAYQRFFGGDNSFSLRVPFSYNYGDVNSSYWYARKLYGIGIGANFWQTVVTNVRVSIGYDLNYSKYEQKSGSSNTGYSISNKHYLTHSLVIGTRVYLHKNFGLHFSINLGFRDDMNTSQLNSTGGINTGFYFAF